MFVNGKKYKHYLLQRFGIWRISVNHYSLYIKKNSHCSLYLCNFCSIYHSNRETITNLIVRREYMMYVRTRKPEMNQKSVSSEIFIKMR